MFALRPLCFVHRAQASCFLKCNTRASSELKYEISDKSHSGTVLPYKSVPKLRSLPLIKAGWVFLPIIGKYSVEQLDKFADDIYQKYGPVVRVDFPLQKSTIWSFDPEDFRTVYLNEGKYPEHIGINPLRVYRQSQKKLNYFVGISQLNGEEWYEMRSRIQRHVLFIPTVESYLSKMEELSKDFLEHITSVASDDGVVYDMLPILQTYAIEVIFYIVFNFKLNCFAHSHDDKSDSVQLRKSANDIMAALGETTFGNQLWRVFPTKTWRKLASSHDTFTNISLKFIEDALEKSKLFSEEDQSLLFKLFHRENMKPKQAVIMAMDLLIGGSDTTSSTATFLLHHISRNPSVQDKLYQEIQSVLGNETMVTPEHLTKMNFLTACIKETLRLEPAVVAASRNLPHEVALSNYQIPAHTPVLISIMSVMRQEKHFPNAKKFVPERWLEGAKKPHPFAYLPFGHGVRSCIGQRIAQQELHMLIIQLLRNYKIESEHTNIGIVTGLTNHPKKPLNMRLSKR